MPASPGSRTPRNFFLNETHELSATEKTGGGRLPTYVGISWARKARRLSTTMGQVVEQVKRSRDPLREKRFFVIANPVREIRKSSTDKRKAPTGTFADKTDFGETHGRVFDRLGLDLLQVTDDGKAVVHGDRERVDQLVARSKTLETLGAREQSRWVTIESFDIVPLELRVDAEWLDELKTKSTSDVVIELQPVLTRVEADTVLRVLADLLSQREGEALIGTGTDFSGRYWFRGRATRQSVRAIALDFYSVQSIHSPLYSVATRGGRLVRERISIQRTQSTTPDNARELPCVAVVDLGVPADHLQLGPYRRGQFIPADATISPVGDHGTFVASRVVFGDCQSSDELTSSIGKCSFYDARVGDYPDGAGGPDRVNDKIVIEAIRGVRGAAPDVRVLNLSFGDSRPLTSLRPVEQREKRLLLQDLDNFAFATDSVIVVAAGNSVVGAVPTPEYPTNYEDADWALGAWAAGFNTLVCGAFVNKITAGGLASSLGWPSPFTRVGPGVCEAPVPSFCGPGGNTDQGYGYRPGFGVWGFSDRGLPEDRIGTSHAAPILAREAAIAIDSLERYCAPGTQPFAVLVRAFLALFARRTTNDAAVAILASRTLGLGETAARRLESPLGGTAVIAWQGIITSPKDTLRVQLPIPLDWISAATNPVLRLVVCSDPPVNEAGLGVWACRRVRTVLRPGPEATALRSPRGLHESYPLLLKDYNLQPYGAGQPKEAEGDLWLVELSYDEIFVTPPGTIFDPGQRVAFVAELIDFDDEPLDPQAALQALPIASSMNRLSVQAAPIRNPIILRTRG